MVQQELGAGEDGGGDSAVGAGEDGGGGGACDDGEDGGGEDGGGGGGAGGAGKDVGPTRRHLPRGWGNGAPHRPAPPSVAAAVP